VTDIAGRTLTVTDAAGNVTTTTYGPCCDQPATITDAQGNTSCYRYDERGRKVAEWGTGIQPACFGYDEADNLVSLKTFRAGTETITSEPTERTDFDQTTWNFDVATGLELSKTYADNSSVVKTYDAFNRLATETDARGIVKTHSYEPARGLLLSTGYSDDTAARSFAYNHLGQLTQVTDDAGVRTIGYNAFGEQETDSLLAGDKTHLITETRDALGRSTGFTYSKDGAVQHSVTTGYGADGRIATAGFLHGGSEKQFGYTYLPGSHLLQTLTMPCNMTLTQSYETQRDLLIGMAYHRGSTLVTQRSYSYDTLGRPLTRSTNRSGQTVNDSFGYNTRSELTSATVNSTNYGYDYDHIGNRITAEEGESSTEYTANELNQYTAVGDFAPTFDAAGNQTLLKTATGIWSVEYNAENRPVRFTSTDGSTLIECSYDTHGRRATKKVTTNGSVTLHQRYIYRGYLQIACCDLSRAAHPALWFITWDPTQPIATRPLALRKDGTWFAYGWDLTKNICEVFGPAGYIRTAYTYSPYGSVTASGDVTQPIQWSSEYNDTELGLVYYNFRHYNPMEGRWLGMDASTYADKARLYLFAKNIPVYLWDYLGNVVPIIPAEVQNTAARAYQDAMTPPALPITWEKVDLETAKYHYKHGDGRNVQIDFNLVNTSSVNIARDFEDVASWLSSQQLDSGGCKSTSKSFQKAKYTYSTKYPEFLVLGSITLKFQGDVSIDCDCIYSIKGNLKSYDDTYDFEMHKSWNPVELARNAATIIGSWYHGDGKPYDILIRGSKTIDETGKLE
ncbi:MAG: lipid II-degrading bacteriocin, partial [Akkermansia sp.]|nr:lipid II-degrading bacteriocin [Akkermansia sp.]